MSHRLAEVLYQKAASGGGQPPDGAASPETAEAGARKDGDVVDAEVVDKE